MGSLTLPQGSPVGQGEQPHEAASEKSEPAHSAQKGELVEVIRT